MGKKILVIDDDKLVLMTLKRLLAKEGYKISTATSGTEGLRRIENEDFDLILSDIKMPGMDGVEMVKRIREMVMASRVTIAIWAVRFFAPKKKVKTIRLSPPAIKTNHNKGSIPVLESMILCLLNSLSKFSFRTDSSKKDCSVEVLG